MVRFWPSEVQCRPFNRRYTLIQFRLIVTIAAVVAGVASVSVAHAKPHIGDLPKDAISRDILSHRLAKIDQGAPRGMNPSYTIHLNFPQLIEQNFAALDAQSAARLFDNLSDRELGDLAQLYTTATSDSGHPPKILAVLAQRLDGARLGRASQHFGFAPVYEAVTIFSAHKSLEFQRNSQIAFSAPIPGRPLSLSRGKVVSNGFIGPNAGVGEFLNYTPFEIYLAFRTSPIGALGAAGAAYETTVLMSGALGQAFGLGYAVGSLLAPVLQTYAPNLYEAIGGTLNQVIENIMSTPPATPARGDAEKSGAEVFSLDPIASNEIYDTGGDYEVASDWRDYGGGGGGGCWGKPVLGTNIAESC